MITFKARIKKLRFHFELTKSGAIARRYFVIGAFDGALTILGVILGAYVAESSLHPELAKQLILGAGVAGGVALAVSSAVGAYEAERVEHLLSHRHLEKAMLCAVEGTRKDAINVSVLVSAFAHGIAPLLAAFVPLVPFFFMELDEAVVTGTDPDPRTLVRARGVPRQPHQGDARIHRPQVRHRGARHRDRAHPDRRTLKAWNIPRSHHFSAQSADNNIGQCTFLATFHAQGHKEGAVTTLRLSTPFCDCSIVASERTLSASPSNEMTSRHVCFVRCMCIVAPTTSW